MPSIRPAEPGEADSGESVAVIGCGYTGKAVAKYWHQQGLVVTGTTTREENRTELASITSRSLVMSGNDPKAVEEILHDHQTVLVSIAPISDRQVNAATYRMTYLSMAQNLSRAWEKHSTGTQVIYLSSCSVYGNKNGDWVDETSAVDRVGEYSGALLEAEEALMAMDSICILRLGGIYGIGRELRRRIGRMAGKTLPGSGHQWTSWIHQDDIVAGVEFIRKHRCKGIYNLVNDVKLTSRDLCTMICEQELLEPIRWDEQKAAFSEVNARVDNRKIKSAGFHFLHPDHLI